MRLRVPLLALLLAGCGASPPPDAPPDPPVEEETAPPGELVLPGSWDWCPPSSEAQGTGSAVLELGSEALYCGTFDEARSLAEEAELGALLRLVAGAVPLPTVDGITEVTLPACVELDPGEEGLVSSGSGTLDTATDLGGSGSYRLLLEQPLVASDGQAWQLTLWLQGPSEDLVQQELIRLDGEHLGIATDPDRTAFFQLCEGSCSDFADGRAFDSCRFDGVPTQRHTLSFERGWVELDLRIGMSFAATQPALFAGGRGELDGEPFEQRDYWELLYNPTHHHFSRDFVLFFDGPTGEAEGLLVEEVDPFQSAPPSRIWTVDSELSPLEELSIQEETFSSSVE